MKWRTPSIINRQGIVLSPADMPYASALTFNAGVAKFHGEYIMVFRNDYAFSRQDFADFYAGISDNTVPQTNMGLARSRDGVHWQVSAKPCFEFKDSDISRAYDPRLTVIGDECVMCFALDGKYGTRGGIATTRDFQNFSVKNITAPENRNLVVFPEKTNGMYYRLERPFLSSNSKAYDIWISSSPDLIHWGNTRLLLGHDQVPFANSKIGPGAPPLKTPYGWLTLFHGVYNEADPLPSWSRNWVSTYYTGIMLLDLKNPSKVIAMGKSPLLTPETNYELDGFRGNVIFPGGLIGEPDGTAKIYYGAADTVECLATAKIDDLVQFCYNDNNQPHRRHYEEAEIYAH